MRQPLIANQVQLSITHANLIAQGVAMNMDGLDQSIDRTLGLIDYARKERITLQAWSPYQKGFFDGVFVGDREALPELNTALDEIAASHGITPTGVATAWITRHPAKIQVVLGTTRPSRVREAVAGACGCRAKSGIGCSVPQAMPSPDGPGGPPRRRSGPHRLKWAPAAASRRGLARFSCQGC